MDDQRNGYDESDRLNLKLVVALARSMKRIHRETASLLNEEKLTPAQFGVLELLYHKGEQRIREIIEKSLSTGGNMTVVIANLERAGLVERSKDPEDGRASLIRLSEAGYQTIRRIFPVHVAYLKKALAVLAASEKAALLSQLKRIGLQ